MYTAMVNLFSLQYNIALNKLITIALFILFTSIQPLNSLDSASFYFPNMVYQYFSYHELFYYILTLPHEEVKFNYPLLWVGL